MQRAVFSCSRDRFTWIFTGAILGVILGVSATSYVSLAAAGAVVPGAIVVCINIALIAGVAVFLPLTYEVTDDTVVVRRIGPDIIISRADITRVGSITWETLSGSIRLGANGGLGGYVGLFSNKTLGRYRAYMTRKDRLFLIETNDCTVVISPDDPERFVALFPFDPAAA